MTEPDPNRNTSRQDALDLDVLRDGLEHAVSQANRAILDVIAQDTVRVGHKPGEGPVTEADHAADDVLHHELIDLIDGAHWISEESKQEAPLIHGEPTWVVDPLDGTREFLRGLPEFGVSVGLFVDDEIVLGAVGLPLSEDPDGAPSVLSGLIDGDRLEARVDGAPIPSLAGRTEVERVVVSRHDYEWRQLHYQIPFDVYPCGSAAVKLVHSADGQADVYFSTGPRSVWDVAGGVAILEAAGGSLLMLNGKPLSLSPQQIQIPPYVAGPRGSCLTLLRRLGATIAD